MDSIRTPDRLPTDSQLNPDEPPRDPRQIQRNSDRPWLTPTDPQRTQESVRSPSGFCQKPFRIFLVTKFGELIWRALQIETYIISNRFLRVWRNLIGPLTDPDGLPTDPGVGQESIRSLSEAYQDFFSNQIWRADLKSSPNWDLYNLQ